MANLKDRQDSSKAKGHIDIAKVVAKKGCSKFEHSSLTSRTQLKILTFLGTRKYPAQVATILGLGRSNIQYYVKKFLERGYIESDSRKGYFKFYKLTDLGLKILTGNEGMLGFKCVLEDFPMKYPIFRDETVQVDWEKLGQPNNWNKLGLKVGGLRVERTTQHVIVHSGCFKGFNPYELLLRAFEACNSVAASLEDRFGMRLGRGIPIRRPGFQVRDPGAKFIAQYLTVNSEIGGIDASPPSKEGHLDFWSPEYAQEYLLMPSNISLLDSKIERLNMRLQSLESGLMLIFQTWNLVGNKILELFNSLEVPVSTKKVEALDSEDFKGIYN